MKPDRHQLAFALATGFAIGAASMALDWFYCATTAAALLILYIGRTP
jgi:hypothetical protein